MNKKLKPNISLVIPTYNERQSIDAIIHNIKKTLWRHSYEIIIVDDDSPDGTGAYLKKTYAGDHIVRATIRKQPKNLGKSILCGIQMSKGDIIIGMDADGNHDTQVLLPLIRRLETCDMAIGSRFIQGGSMEDAVHHIGSWSVNCLLRSILLSPIRDLTSGLYAIKRDTLFRLPLDTIYDGYGEYFFRLVYYVNKNHGIISELPSYFKNRRYGFSKSKPIHMFFSYMLAAIRLRFS